MSLHWQQTCWNVYAFCLPVSLLPFIPSGFCPLYSAETALIKITSDFPLPNLMIDSWLSWLCQQHLKHFISPFVLKHFLHLASGIHLPWLFSSLGPLSASFAQSFLSSWPLNALRLVPGSIVLFIYNPSLNDFILTQTSHTSTCQ